MFIYNIYNRPLPYFSNYVSYIHNVKNNVSLTSFLYTFRSFSSIHNNAFNSQRLNARDHMWLVGFVEGDGTFGVNKNGKYVKYNFSIDLQITDIQLLYKIKAILGGYGNITIKRNGKYARYLISSKIILKKVILPIFDKYSMLTAKQYDYLYFKDCLNKNIVFHSDLPMYTPPSYTPFNNIEDILSLYYYDCWLVGFIEAEGHFGCSTSEEDKTSKVCKFSISQTNGLQIIESIKKRLNISSSVYFYEVKSSYTIETNSVRGIENVIHFLKYTPVKLKGLKRAQYLKWLHDLRIIPRYSYINIPSKY